MKKIATIALIILLMAQASADKVALVFKFPDRTHKECVDTAKGTNGYQLLQKTSLDIDYADYGTSGHFIQCVEGKCTEHVGPGAWDYIYWSRYDKFSGEKEWTYSTGSLDGATQPYKANEGDMLAFVYTTGSDTPPAITFCEVCECGGGKGRAQDNFIGLAILPTGKTDTTEIRVFDEETNHSIKDAKVELYDGTAGFTERLFEANTNKDGIAEIPLTSAGEYGLRISAYRYHHLYTTINIEEETTTTTTVTSTTTTTSTTGTTTTLKHFIYDTTSTTTTLNEPAIIGKAIQPTEEKGGWEAYAIALLIVALPVITWARRK